jgi:phosphoribosyl 1,2-cyclic phosphate phosphodiesterase
MTSYRFTILGCGSSGGVPRIGSMWGACDPANPRNRRRRCAALMERIEKGGRTTALIDTPPDIREQLLDIRLTAVDAVLYTHDHADHTHGIDDLRMLAYAMKRRVDCYFDAATLRSLEGRFGYCFKTPEGSTYPPILTSHEIVAARPFSIDGKGGTMEVLPLLQEHGDIKSLGFRIGGLAYSPDVSDLPAETVPLLEGLDVWIVDALRYTPHFTHFHVKRALEWIERLRPRRAVLTHMTGELDYDALKRDLPAGVEPGYDGMVIEL